MSIKKFKFVSPGVFINEIDNSFIPRVADTIGPAVIGRARRGISMQPVRVESYSKFVENFGDTVAGGSGGDVYRDGNLLSPMYGTYAAKAFLRPNVAPLTYMRTLGHQHPEADTSLTDALAGWRTKERAGGGDGGGAFGLFVARSSSYASAEAGGLAAQVTASLAAVWYLQDSRIELSGTVYGADFKSSVNSGTTASFGMPILSDTNGVFKARVVTGSNGTVDVLNFSLNPDDRRYIRKVFNTNPTTIKAGNFYPTSVEKDYWLGETYEQESRDVTGDNLSGVSLVGFIANIALSGSSPTSNTPADMKGVSNKGATEAKAGWFISQDLDAPGANLKVQKLFRLKGRGHGEYLNKNLKVSISNILQSTTSTTNYGTFSVVLRMISDSDGAVQVVERFDKCTLDPASPDFVARKIGDQFFQWSEDQRRLRLYGEYPNLSKFVYVEMNADVEAAATDPLLLPFGFYGPPKFSEAQLTILGPGTTQPAPPSTPNQYVYLEGTGVGSPAKYSLSGGLALKGADEGASAITASLRFPDIRLRNSASAGGLSAENTYFGIETSQTSGSNRFDPSVKMVNRLLTNGIGDDPLESVPTGIDSYGYLFTMDDLVQGTGGTYYDSGSRGSDGRGGRSMTSASYVAALDAGFNKFTAPFWGGFDGLDITKPDPFFNNGMPASSTEKNNYAYYTLLRAIDTLADPEFVDMNLLTSPGLTQPALTERMINVCEDRGDAMALIDLQDGYLPTAEGEYSTRKTKPSRIPYTPTKLAENLRNRAIDSSYGATFYPWVQTREESNGQLLWVPPSVAMMGVLASSERKSHLWFAPAGFNRGGLSDGAAGIPVLGVTTKLTSKERDVLYDSNINPIASFPSTGIVVFGQKTLQTRQSALDRINVRRLVIYLKKQISIISSQILFEQNVPTTWNRFKGLVEPFLANVKTNFGIADYKLILDEATTTPDLVDQNILYAKIMVKPARAIEFIAIDFVVASTGASFDD